MVGICPRAAARYATPCAGKVRRLSTENLAVHFTLRCRQLQEMPPNHAVTCCNFIYGSINLVSVVVAVFDFLIKS